MLQGLIVAVIVVGCAAYAIVALFARVPAARWLRRHLPNSALAQRLADHFSPPPTAGLPCNSCGLKDEHGR